MKNQPVPTNIEYSLERYNVIKRAYWVNGRREKAMSLPCAVQRPLGYIVLLSDSGAVVGKFIVDGKVSSLNSYLFPAYEQTVDYAKEKLDETTSYQSLKQVEDTCRAMIASYKSDCLIWM